MRSGFTGIVQGDEVMMMGQKQRIQVWQTTVLVAACIGLFAGSAVAQSLTFLVPREATLRQNGVATRGQVKLMTPEEIVMVVKGGEQKFVPSTVTSIVAADNTFKFYPAQESFDEFLEKSTKLRGVTVVRDRTAPESGAAGGAGNKSVGGVSDDYARMIGMQPGTDPAVKTSGGGFAQSGGFAGASQRPNELARFEAATIPEEDTASAGKLPEERPRPTTASNAPSGSGPTKTSSSPATEEVLICSNPACGKEVRGAKYGDKCPHCGVLWASQSTAEAVASAAVTPFTYDPKNPFAKPPQATTPNAPAVPPAPAPAIVIDTPPATELSLETIPWWGKLLAFGGSILVLMFVMGRR